VEHYSASEASGLPWRADDESAWEPWSAQWAIEPGVTYLNHGSFGPPPLVVRAARRAWIDRLDADPMDFFVRHQEQALSEVAARLAAFVGATAADLALVENATFGMNTVAANVSLTAGDEVLLTDHEYGAVRRIWQRACDRSGAKLRIATLPFPPQSTEEVVAAIADQFGPRTRLVVVSHITSPTALILPVQEICAAARDANVATCVDGPHALAMLPLDVAALDCDYYTASCHKWLSATFGTGFLYVHPRRQADFQPLNLSWGRTQENRPTAWQEEYLWPGTRDMSGFLSVPAAIDFLQAAPIEAFRARGHFLAKLGAEMINALTGYEPVGDVDRWYGTMVPAELPPGETLPFRDAIWRHAKLHVPIIAWGDRRFVRISCHLYNSRRDVELLAKTIAELGMVTRS